MQLAVTMKVTLEWILREELLMALLAIEGEVQCGQG